MSPGPKTNNFHPNLLEASKGERKAKKRKRKIEKRTKSEREKKRDRKIAIRKGSANKTCL